MKKVLAIALFLGFAAFAYMKVFYKKKVAVDTPKVEAIVLKTHSDAFNASVDAAMADYFKMKDAFVQADAAIVKQYAASFVSKLDSIPMEELDKDKAAISATAKASIEDIKSNVNSLMSQTDITEMRKDFNMVTQMMYPSFFKSINYEGNKLYLQECPMAFDDASAVWLSNDVEIINPYLGNNHPKYKATMLNCGEVKDSVLAGSK